MKKKNYYLFFCNCFTIFLFCKCLYCEAYNRNFIKFNQSNLDNTILISDID